MRQNIGMSRKNIIAKAISIFLICAPLWAAPARATEAQALSAALQSANGGDWQAALAAAKGAGPVGGDIILWQWLRAGNGKLGDYEAFIARRPDWPGMPLLKEKGEIAVARSDDPARVLAYFGADFPRSGIGSAALVRALAALGRTDEARAEAVRGWRSLRFDAEAEALMIELAEAVIAPHHGARADALLWDKGRKAEVQRMVPRLPSDYAALVRARAALQSDAADAPALVSAVPSALAQDAGLAFDRYDYRMRASRYDDAAEMIIARSASAADLGDPQAWGKRRADLARILMRQGKHQTAYRVAASHHLSAGSELADLSFLAGFIALRHLNDPAAAMAHFASLEGAVVTPISVSRAQYWLARAYEAAGDGANATAQYQRAAQHQTAFYGLLAAERLGLALDPALVNVGDAQQAWRSAPFAQSSVLAAARLLLDAGDRTLAKRFFLHLSEGLPPADMSALADLALRLDQPHIAVLLAKAAAERGQILPRAYYPIPAFIPDGLPVSRALALAIARRESEFDPTAQSSVGARGLMQVMPDTAAEVAASMGEASSPARLIKDPAFNVRMGSAYLARLVETYGPAIALVASGYNAGPSRPRKWVQDYGDPRLGSGPGGADIVDWVETIPFTETRTYVMRVAESVVIYRARLRGQSGPVNITAELTGR
jgi:soluble lytic murein transglycosylase